MIIGPWIRDWRSRSTWTPSIGIDLIGEAGRREGDPARARRFSRKSKYWTESGLVEPVLMVVDRPLRGRCARPQHESLLVARQQMLEEEHDRHDAEDDDDRLQNAADEIPEHAD